MTEEVATVLPCARQSAARARRFATQHLRGRVDEEMVQTATLLLSEVVTNAVLHTQSDTAVRVVVDDAAVLVCVEDSSRVQPVRRGHDPEALGGRGLELVEGLADAYGVTDTANGKRVWFTLGGFQPPGPVGWRG